MRCVICGNEAVLDALCRACYIEKNPLLAGYKEFSIKHCVGCDKSNVGTWKRIDNPEAFFKDEVKKHMKLASSSGKVSVDVDITIPKHKRNAGVKVKCVADVEIEREHGPSLIDNYTFPFTIEYTYCNGCGKKGTEYYEGTIQLRGSGKVFSEALAFLKEEVAKLKEKGVFINKEVELPQGLDLYLTSQRRLPKLVEAVQKKFGGIVKVSEQLFSRDRQGSKDIFRVNAYLLLPSFAVRDVIVVENNLVQISSIVGKKIVGFNLKTWKKVSSVYDHYEVVAHADDFSKVQVSRWKPTLEVLHPRTYQSTQIENPKEISHKKEIDVIEREEQLFLVD